MHDGNCIEIKGLSKHYSGSEIGRVEALSNLNLTISKGESVGIVGANGAGKSTLLKVLSRITPPSSGEAFIRGKITSLLEVGTGLHPELSGTDNILLYGSVLGISFKEIRKIQPQIIEFSGLKEKIDLPVKKFSSGMKLRLAFSVMAHLPVDVLALDEVLAVGDSMFQQKCMQRMLDIKKGGHTLLFVSHDLSAVRSLCERTIVLESGKLVFDGPTEKAIAFYRSLAESTKGEFDLEIHKTGNESAWISSLMFDKEELKVDRPLNGTIRIDAENNSSNSVELGINLRSMTGTDLYHISNRFLNQEIELKESATLEFSIQHQLKPGKYHLCLYLKVDDIEQQWLENVASIEITGGAPYGFLDRSQIQSDLVPEFTIKQK